MRAFIVIRFAELPDGSAGSFHAIASFPTFEQARLYVSVMPVEADIDGNPVKYIIDEVPRMRAFVV